MSKKSKISFIGGDLRLYYMAKEIAEMGYETGTYCVTSEETLANSISFSSLKEALDFSDVIVGPVPFSKTQVTINSTISAKDLEVKHFLTCLTPSHTLYGGAFSSPVKSYCDANNIPYVDFMKIEEVAILNAIATAEGTIAEAIQQSPINLCNSKVLVLGYGRCGSVLAAKLKGLDANVYVSARKSTVLAEARCTGFQTIPFNDLANSLSEFLFIFNSIPAIYFDESLLKEVSTDATFIDISSSPGCVVMEDAKRLGVKSSLCLGLPGKYAPKTSAEILTKALISSLESQK